MTRCLVRILSAALVAAFCVALVAAPPGAAMPDDEPVAVPVVAPELGPPAPPADRQDFFVVLSDPPVAQYRGGIAGLKPSAVRPGGPVHLDWDSPAARAYGAWLDARRAVAIEAVRAVAPEMLLGWQWKLVLNGFSVTVDPASAARIRALPGVRVVHPAEDLEPEMDSTPALIHLSDAWDAAGGDAEAGLGARIGTMEGGQVEHPWFRDEGMPDPPAGFPRAQLIGRNATYDYPDASLFTNRKLVGAYMIVDTAETTMLTSTTSTPSLCPLSVACNSTASHGAHVMGTATGRWDEYAFTVGAETLRRRMGGIAPMAELFTYKNLDGTLGMVAGIEQMVKDGIDVFNASLGQVLWLTGAVDTHPITLAIDAAADAGTLAVVSSGNAGGNGPTSLSGTWKYSERLLTVGSTAPTGMNARRLTVTGEGLPSGSRPVAYASFSGGTVGGVAVRSITETITAGIVHVDDGCTPRSDVAGKVAFLKRFNADSSPYGECAFEARRANMLDSGALAVIFYYEDVLYRGESSTVAPRAVAIGWEGGYDVQQWLLAGGTGTVTIEPGIGRAYDGAVDIVAASSSQGPGLGWAIKPDISAPGDGILSSVATGRNDQRVYTIAELGGTSMAAPHVTGAAALLRSIHPDWTTDQVRTTLINTSVPAARVFDTTVTPVGPRPATPGEGGPGRLDLAYAADPGVFLAPPKLTFGTVPEGATRTITTTITSASATAETWTLTVEAGAGDAVVRVSPARLDLAAGATASYAVTIETAGTTGTDHWGRVVLRRGATDHVLRQTYFAYIDRPTDRRDVLLVDWTYGNTPDYADVYTSTLEALGLTYTVWHMGEPADGGDVRTEHPPYRELFRHDLVIVNTNESPISLQAQLAGQFQYQNHMLGGGNMLIVGQGTPNFWRYLNWGTRYADTETYRQALPDTWPYAWSGANQNVACEMCLARYFAGFTPEITATLSGRLLVPFPSVPDRPERAVVLPPHPDGAKPFTYPIDLSTGSTRPAGAAGNQYMFASGSVIAGYTPSTSSQVTAGLADYSYAEGVLDAVVPIARPLWSYSGDFKSADGASEVMTKTVGTYVAGRQHPEAKVPWNAMFWGFGLEGVGAGAPGTVSQATLLGDTFNFLAHNLYGVTTRTVSDEMRDAVIGLALPEFATAPPVGAAVIDWGDGSPAVTVTLPVPLPADRVALRHAYATPGTYPVRVHVLPAAHAAPFDATGLVSVVWTPPTIYLPFTANSATMPATHVDMAPTRDLRPTGRPVGWLERRAE